MRARLSLVASAVLGGLPSQSRRRLPAKDTVRRVNDIAQFPLAHVNAVISSMPPGPPADGEH